MSGFQPRDLLREQLVLAVDAWPDGGRIWSMRRPSEDGRGYRCELWHRPADSPPHHVALPFSLSAAPRYLADGRVAVVGADHGEPQLWRVALDGSAPERLTEGLHVLDAAPSPTDRSIVFRAYAGPDRFLVGGDVARAIASTVIVEDGEGFRDRWAHAFAWRGGSVAPLMTGEHAVRACGWSADGSELWLLVARVRERPYECDELWTVRPGGVPELAVADPGQVFDAALSPDARRLAWIARPRWFSETRLYVLDRASGATRRLDAGLCVDQATFPDVLPPQSPCTQLTWTDAGEAVLAIATVRGEPQVYRFPLEGEPRSQLARSVGFLRRAAGATLVIGAEGSAPAEALELDGDGARPLSSHGDWLPRSARPRVCELSVHRDGVEVHGWVVEARDGTPRDAPLVLHVHGGPYSAHCPLPWLEMDALVARGYRVLVPNPRGSSSYGDEHSAAIVGCWGGVDAGDLHAFVEAALERGLGDPARVGVIGLSYGGFMAVQLIATSDRFVAAVAENPVTNFVSEIGLSDLGLLGADLAFGDETVDLDAWWKASPLRRAPDITTPLLLLHAEADQRCPVAESSQLFWVLKSLGRQTELVRFPEESHMMFQIGRPDRRVYRLQRILGWFDEHLMGASRPVNA